ncbi:hypothetical protein [Pseudomonas tructae]|uniref:hypothetical protein n=1 Tax=Pseudomonas tructae TaxID=2518644 RepID=UPI001E418039|nr:hypothetical protein [Pseudomonas tructae]
MESGLALDVKARVSRGGSTQLFLGVYTRAGLPIVEEYHDRLVEISVARAIVWGVKRCRAIAAEVIELDEQPAMRVHTGLRTITPAS